MERLTRTLIVCAVAAMAIAVPRDARAYSVLLNDRSKEIVKRLGMKEPAHQAPLCLDCHSHDVPTSLRGERLTQ